MSTHCGLVKKGKFESGLQKTDPRIAVKSHEPMYTRLLLSLIYEKQYLSGDIAEACRYMYVY